MYALQTKLTLGEGSRNRAILKTLFATPHRQGSVENQSDFILGYHQKHFYLFHNFPGSFSNYLKAHRFKIVYSQANRLQIFQISA